MIDVHFHCLPGIDDGPTSWESAVSLCRTAVADGITTIIATPHVLRGAWLNDDPSARDDMIATLNGLLGGVPTILPGCEYYFSRDALDLWDQGTKSPLTGLNRSNYLLIEFPVTHIPDRAEALLYEMIVAGVKPVIAHPERNLVFAEQPSKLKRFVELGALAQLTSGSITGAFGRAALAASDEFIRRDLVHLVASDSHSIEKRPPTMTAARDSIRKRWGTDAEQILFESTQSLIVANDPR